MEETPWIVAECDEALAAALAASAGVPPIVGRLLANRGVTTPQAAREFMDPSLAHLHAPSLLPDLDLGVDRLASALASGERISVHGDYDVDGVTSTALIVRTLRALKANVEPRLPHRQRDGYDINVAAVEVMAREGTRLIVTCDCGARACDAVQRANELGIDVIITDHHEQGADLPPALAVINPKRADAEYPFPDLAGVGVAFKFAQGLVRKLGLNEESFVTHFVDLAALGTVGDVVPLIDENRAIVKHGMEALPTSKKVGIRTMIRAAGLEGKTLTSYYLGYVLGPRINAVGRMADASAALRLMLTNDEAEAGRLASEMERRNTERRAEQERIMAEALQQAQAKVSAGMRVLVLSNEGWNTGVIGVVAGKIRENYGRPAILVSRNEQAGIGCGSARSVEGFNVAEALRCCGDLLSRFGGHALAAGLSLPLANLGPLEEKLNALAFEIIAEEELAPRIELDAEIDAREITRELADAIALMEPFGAGNPEPIFLTQRLRLAAMQRVGDGSHLRLTVQGEGAAPIGCIAFRMGDAADVFQLGGLVDLCYSVRLNTFDGEESVQLVGKAIRVTGDGDQGTGAKGRAPGPWSL